MDYTPETFLETVKGFKIEIVKDDGVHRHIKMSDGTFNKHYEITTFPGYLCYVGDMGDFVFSRVDDMFTFFRHDELSINKGYWHEKLKSVSRFGGDVEFSYETFKENVKTEFDNWVDAEFPLEETKESVWRSIEEDVLGADNEHEAYEATNDFSCEGFDFDCFYEHDLTKYTGHFIWCLYAIVFAIQKYDKETKDPNPQQ